MEAREEREAAEVLYESEKKYRMLVETMNDGLITRNAEGIISYVNPRLCDMLGYTQEELVGRPVADFLDEANKEILKRQLKYRRMGGSEPYELMLTRKDGARLYTLMSPKSVFDHNGQFIGSFAVVTDITSRKQEDNELRESEKMLRLLSSHLFVAQERERERISRELHDEVGQDLAILKYQIRFIAGKLRKDQGVLKQACEDALEHLNQVVENIRIISRDLSPAVLKNLGLTASIKKMVEGFEKLGQVRISAEIDNIDRLLSPEREVNLYRIFREGLTNIGKHAQATHVFISVKHIDRMILCRLKDDGTGFDIEKEKRVRSPQEGLGLLTMQERSRMLGGYLDIQSHEGKGTEIFLSFPVDQVGVYGGAVSHFVG
jgi:PAS domain S-box-containing protein